MTKIVQGIGDAIGDVFRGAVKVVKNVADGVGDLARGIANSPIGKAILIAGAIYFGGAALAGGFGSSAAGGSFFSGMGTGVASAAETLSGAWSSTLAGNFGEAASSIGNAWGTAGTAGGNSAVMTEALRSGVGIEGLKSSATIPGASSSNVAALGPGSTQVAAAAPGAGTGLTAGGAELTAGGSGLTSGAATNAATYAGAPSPFSLTAAGTGTPGLSGTLPAMGAPAAAAPAGWWAGVDPYLKTAAVMGGTQVVGGLIAGAGQAKAAEDQRNAEAQAAQDARDRYNTNVGTPLDFTKERAVADIQPYTPKPAWDPQAAARDLIAKYYQQIQGSPQDYMASLQRQAQPGVISRYMPPVRG
jgi:hypothetical protein